MNPTIIPSIERAFGAALVRRQPVGGGCISAAERLWFDNHRTVFVKYNAGLRGAFPKEARGLRELAKAEVLTIPGVLFVNDDCIVLQWIEAGEKSPTFMEEFGRGLAQLHRQTQADFGWHEDNYLGASPQLNASEQTGLSWAEFFWEFRLLFQLKLAEENGFATSELRKRMNALEQNLDKLLEGSEESPSLLHGDLWSGNVLVDSEGHPCLIDPAVYYGHREAEFGMTSLFGGFGPSFYDAYNEVFPLPPGHKERLGLYQLYHLLNHMNLFGGGYYDQSLAVLKAYT